jgi:hypothetical protein
MKNISKFLFSIIVSASAFNSLNAAAPSSDCKISKTFLNAAMTEQMSKIEDYDRCLRREGSADISFNYTGFICDFHASHAQRGQAKLSLAAQAAHRACALDAITLSAVRTMGTPQSILPQEFAASTVAKRAPKDRGR